MACYRLLTQSPDAPGIVSKVSHFITEHGGNILYANQHVDHESNQLFMRYEISKEGFVLDKEGFCHNFSQVAASLGMHWNLLDSAKKKRVILMGSLESHCISDLLHRYHDRELPAEIVAVISNHERLSSMVAWHQVPFHCVDMKSEKAFQEIAALWEKYNADAVVLAKFMQVIPKNLCDRFEGKIINIHHSSLPSFAGAKPYHQAYQRGVKLVGATCHYVTEELDAGPIIDQDVVRISHRDTIEEIIRKGKDIERMVLSRGLRHLLEDKVFINGNKTIVFE